MNTDGILCTVTDPAASLDLLVTAVEDLLTADQCPNPAYARRASARQAAEALSAYCDAVGAGINPKQANAPIVQGWAR